MCWEGVLRENLKSCRALTMWLWNHKTVGRTALGLWFAIMIAGCAKIETTQNEQARPGEMEQVSSGQDDKENEINTGIQNSAETETVLGSPQSNSEEANRPMTVRIGEIDWYTDYDASVKLAKLEGKPIWLHFGENPG